MAIAQPSIDLLFNAWTNSDWVGDLDTCQSTSNYHIQLANGLIFWQSKKQKILILSSIEAQYIGVANVRKEIIWLQHLLLEIGFSQPFPTSLYYTNQSFLSLTKNPYYYDHSIHIELWYHFLCEKLENNKIAFEFTPTQYMSANIFNKALSKTKY